nr:hypothetical protein [Kibdelosporangium sp. MJ126-NF4]
MTRLDGATREVKLPADYRHDLVVQRTELVNQPRWNLHEIAPGLQVPFCGLRHYHVIDDLAHRLANHADVVSRIAREMVTRCRELTQQINALEQEPRDRVRVLAPMLWMCLAHDAATDERLPQVAWRRSIKETR